MDTSVPVMLITGPVGAGKTTVAAEVSDNITVLQDGFACRAASG
jgi:adenylate kinase family enzyme